jgi:hypothetical protein
MMNHMVFLMVWKAGTCHEKVTGEPSQEALGILSYKKTLG